MSNSKVNNFINFLYEDTEENNEIINKELKDAGLNTKNFQKKMLNLLDENERELKFEKGRKLKELYEQIKFRIQNSEFRIQENNTYYNVELAFRNVAEKLSEQEIENIIKDDQLLDEMLKEFGRNGEQ
jgi:hypothetical protein